MSERHYLEGRQLEVKLPQDKGTDEVVYPGVSFSSLLALFIELSFFVSAICKAEYPSKEVQRLTRSNLLEPRLSLVDV